MNKIETNMNMKTITITNDFVCYQQGGIGKEIIIAVDELLEENKQLKERIDNQEFLLVSQGKELKKLYSTINETIEYIEENSHYYNSDGEIGFVIEEGKEEIFCKDLLKLLKGEDNDIR